MKSVIVHGVLAALGLLAAWVVWTEEAETGVSADSVELVDCDEVTSVSLRSQDRVVRVERKDGFDWITIEPVAQDQVSSATAEPRHFLANESTEEWFELFTPLRAARSLGEVSDDLIEELELKDDSPLLELVCDGSTTTYRVGGATFGSSANRYVQGEDGGAVYLIDANIVTQLTSAEAALVQRKLYRFEVEEIERLRLQVSGRDITLLQRDRRAEGGGTWVDANDPERRNDVYGNWFARLEDLSVTSYLDLDAQPGSDLEDASGVAVTPVLTIDFMGEDGDTIDRLELTKVETERPTYYAKSNTTRAWVRVPDSVARLVENDARLVLGLEPLPEPEPEPAEVPQGEDGGVDGGVPEGAETGDDGHGHGPGDGHGHGAPTTPTAPTPPGVTTMAPAPAMAATTTAMSPTAMTATAMAPAPTAMTATMAASMTETTP